jgi:hypothetical protein
MSVFNLNMKLNLSHADDTGGVRVVLGSGVYTLHTVTNAAHIDGQTSATRTQHDVVALVLSSLLLLCL